MELVKSKKVPLPLRILAAVVIFGLYGGVVFLIVWAGFGCLNNTEIEHGTLFAVILFVAAALVAGALLWQFVKAFRKHNS